MDDYFSAIEAHLQDRLDIDSSNNPNADLVCTLGVDNLIYLRDATTSQEQRFDLPEGHGHTALALAPQGLKCCLGGTLNTVMEFNFENSVSTKICETLGTIKALKYSRSGRYLAVASEEPKCVVVDIRSGRKQKCRPGHTSSLSSVYFSPDDQFVASIGADQYLLIYRIGEEQPQEVLRNKITSLGDTSTLQASFQTHPQMLLIPGAVALQRAELIGPKWDFGKFNRIHHSSPILAVQSLKGLIATAISQELFIWSSRSEEKLVHILDFSLRKIVPTHQGFCGVRNDGKIYCYKRSLPQDEPIAQPMTQAMAQAMDIQQISGDNEDDKMEFEREELGGDEVETKLRYIRSKKSKADKIVTCYPQDAVQRSTDECDSARFLTVNMAGAVIERREAEENIIEAEYNAHSRKKIIFRNKVCTLFDLNQSFLIYATQEDIGLISHQQHMASSWERKCSDIQSVTLGKTWFAAATEEDIRVYHVSGQLMKSISFDRQVVSMAAHQNQLAVCYHQAIPIMGSQRLALQLYQVDFQEVIKQCHTHVPIKSLSSLRWFGFSKEGMLLSQDSSGDLRVYNLHSNQWSSVYTPDVEESRRIWLIGMEEYCIYYWKTTDLEPSPTVSPRLNVKKSELALMVGDESPQGTLYSKLLWRRLKLDHEKTRMRFWGRQGVDNGLMSQKELKTKHMQLDYEFEEMVRRLLKQNEPQRALGVAKAHVRSIEIGRTLVEIFDDFKMRPLAVELELFFDERERLLEYEEMQSHRLTELRQMAERSIRPKLSNPMKRGKRLESIPSLSPNYSQESFGSLGGPLRTSNVSSEPSVEGGQPAVENPFLKKNSSHSDALNRKREIDEQVEKYGIKRKVQDKFAKLNSAMK